MTHAETNYVKFIDDLNLLHFNGREFLAYARRTNAGGSAGIPPKAMWSKIVPTIRVVDQLREYFGKSIRLSSIYRSEGYNRACGGASKSFHKRFMALDIQVSNKSPRTVANKLKQWRAAGVFRGGIGTYSTFVHIDTRGYTATW